MSILVPDFGLMSDAELHAHIDEIEKCDDIAALRNPMTLLRRVKPGYRIRPHLAVIANAMEKINSGEIDRLLITVPPQTGKTVTAVVGGSFWWLAKHPTDRIVIGSYGEALAVDRGSDVRKLVREQGHRFDLQLEYGSTSKQDWRLTSGGGIKSVGIGTGVTGMPGDIAFIDDPHKSRQEADSLTHRNRVEKWLSADIISRLSPEAPIVVILTRWHDDDIASRVMAQEGTVDKGGRWLFIRMPALCDDPESDPLGRAIGEPLPHPKIRLGDKAKALRHWENKRSGSSIQDWHALYQCDPRPVAGALITREQLRQQRAFATGTRSHPANTIAIRSAVAIDPSGGGRDTAGIIGGYLAEDGRLYISSDETGVMASDVWARRACELAEHIDADLMIVETNFGGDMASRLLKTAWRSLADAARQEATATLVAAEPDLTHQQVEQHVNGMTLPYGRHCPRVKAVRAKKNKRLRAEPIAQQWIEDRIRTSSFLAELEDEWATWQPGSSDSPGRIDASTYLAYALLPINPAGPNVGALPSGSLPTTSASPLGSFGGISTFGALG